MWRGWEKSHDLSVVVSWKISDLKLSYVAFKALIIYLDISLYIMNIIKEKYHLGPYLELK